MKKIKIILIVLGIIAILGIIFFVIDYNRVKNKELPIFCVEIGGYLDGGTHEYLGLLYKVIVFNKMVAIPDYNYDVYTAIKYEDIKIGTWCMQYSDFDEEINEYFKKYEEKNK